MRPLPTNHKVLTWLCICPVDIDNQWKKPLYTLYSAILVITNICGLLSSGSFFFEHYSTDLKVSLLGLYQLISSINFIYGYAGAFHLRHKITGIFVALRKIYDDHENDKSFHFLVQANNSSERIWHYYFRFAMGGFFVSMTAVFTVTISFCLLTNRNFDIKYLYINLPWDQETLLGYIAMTCLTFVFGYFYLILDGAILLLFISLCLHHRAFFNIFQGIAFKLDLSNDEQNTNKILCEAIQFHSSVKKFFAESAKVYSLFILTHMFLCMFFLASCVFQIHLQFGHFDQGIYMHLLALATSIPNLFLFCYFGAMATESYERMANCLYESNWIECPVHLQKYFVIMIRDMQRSHFYQGFGIVVLNFETFTTMLRRTYTFYTLFKTIAK